MCWGTLCCKMGKKKRTEHEKWENARQYILTTNN